MIPGLVTARECPRWSSGNVGSGWRDPTVVLPADGHVHSEWSWDAVDGSMERTAPAVAMGLPAVAFTEHADYTPWEFFAGP